MNRHSGLFVSCVIVLCYVVMQSLKDDNNSALLTNLKPWGTNPSKESALITKITNLTFTFRKLGPCPFIYLPRNHLKQNMTDVWVIYAA